MIYLIEHRYMATIPICNLVWVGFLNCNISNLEPKDPTLYEIKAELACVTAIILLHNLAPNVGRKYDATFRS